MFYTRCKTTCSKPWSCPRNGRRRRTPNKPHQGQNGRLPAQVEARVAHEKKCQEAVEAETIFNGTIKDTLAKNEALEKHVKTVTMRADAFATTEADFFKALLDRQEEAQKHLNELVAQLSHQNTATRSTQ